MRSITPLREGDADRLESWRYVAPYDFYDGEGEPILNPERYFAVRDGDDLVGFYYFEEQGDAVEIGLGLRPDLTGRQLGLEFFLAGVAFAHERFRGRRVVLSVAAFNERAIKVYERAGFVRSGAHVRTFERWGDVEFIELEERR